MGAYQVSFFLFCNELFWLAYPRKKQPQKKNKFKTEPFQVPKIKSFSVSTLAHLQTKCGGAIGNNFGEHIGDIWGGHTWEHGGKTRILCFLP